MTKNRYVVRPCDNAGTLPDAPRDRTWDVWDTQYDTIWSTHDSRAAARKSAAEVNAHAHNVERGYRESVLAEKRGW